MTLPSWIFEHLLEVPDRIGKLPHRFEPGGEFVPPGDVFGIAVCPRRVDVDLLLQRPELQLFERLLVGFAGVLCKAFLRHMNLLLGPADLAVFDNLLNLDVVARGRERVGQGLSRLLELLVFLQQFCQLQTRLHLGRIVLNRLAKRHHRIGRGVSGRRSGGWLHRGPHAAGATGTDRLLDLQA